MSSTATTPLADHGQPQPSKPLSSIRAAILQHISEIVDELIEEEETGTFKTDIDRNEFMVHMTHLIDEGFVSAEMLASLSHEDLKARVENVMWGETVAGMLNELTSEQIEAFDEALKDMRRM